MKKTTNNTKVKGPFYKGISFWLIIAAIVSVLLLLVDKVYNKESLGLVSNILQVFTVAIAISAWMVARDNLKKRKRILEAAEKGAGTVAVIVDIADKDSDTHGKGIIRQVKDYLTRRGFINSNINDDKPKLLPGNVPNNFKIELFYSGKLVNLIGVRMPEDTTDALEYVDQFKATLKIVENNLRERGVTEILLFYNGPAVITFFVGEDFKNNFTVGVYHYTKTTYIPLR